MTTTTTNMSSSSSLEPTINVRLLVNHVSIDMRIPYVMMGQASTGTTTSQQKQQPRPKTLLWTLNTQRVHRSL